MAADLRARGLELIEELKGHIQKVLELHPKGISGVSLQDLEEVTGLVIKGSTGQNVWDMGVATLLIELVKDGRIKSTIPVGRLNTKSASQSLFSRK